MPMWFVKPARLLKADTAGYSVCVQLLFVIYLFILTTQGTKLSLNLVPIGPIFAKFSRLLGER